MVGASHLLQRPRGARRPKDTNSLSPDPAAGSEDSRVPVFDELIERREFRRHVALGNGLERLFLQILDRARHATFHDELEKSGRHQNTMHPPVLRDPDRAGLRGVLIPSHVLLKCGRCDFHRQPSVSGTYTVRSTAMAKFERHIRSKWLRISRARRRNRECLEIRHAWRTRA